MVEDPIILVTLKVTVEVIKWLLAKAVEDDSFKLFEFHLFSFLIEVSFVIKLFDFKFVKTIAMFKVVLRDSI